SHHFDDFASLGSLALVAAGLLVMTLLCQGVVLLLMARATLRAGWLVIALCLGVGLLREPLAERPNPLLASAPQVERKHGECDQLASVQQASAAERGPAPTDASAEPSILISAEGGGIRAAYWTAVSLEELSEARKMPLLKNTDILSGVSGGSLGVATF